MTAISEDRTEQLLKDTRPDSELSREEIIARNLAGVEAHFHNENPQDIDKAIAFYTDDISWEAPARGQIDTDPAVVRAKYIDLFNSWTIHKSVSLRRFATEQFVFDDQILYGTVADSLIPNLPYKVGDRVSARLVHCFEMRDGRIAREIAYEVWRDRDSVNDHDAVPDHSEVQLYTAE